MTSITKPPSGNVTFLFTDIVGSTEAWEKHGDAFLPILQAHNAIISEAVERFGGYVMKTEGDAFKIVFSDPSAAAKCAIVAQAALHRYPWPADVGKLMVRMALHTGDPIVHDRDYFGPPVNRTARILSTVHGGQIMISEETLTRIEYRMDPGTRFLDLGFHRLKDLDAEARLFQLEHPALEVRSFPPPRSLSAHANNLPIQRTSFVGREKELEQIASLLGNEDTQLLKLTGKQGIGKTRLALQAGAEKIELFPDGVWHIRLTSACDAHGAAQEVARQLGIEISPGESELETVRAWLAERQCLLILDDCGHLPQSDRLIRELLTGASSLRCLAISRESLSVEGGEELEVPELGLPKEDADAKALLASEAGRLFVERAHAARPDFTLNDRRAGSFARLLKNAIGGIPDRIEKVTAMMTYRPLGEVVRKVTQDVKHTAEVAVVRGREIAAHLRDNPELQGLIQTISGEADRNALSEAERIEREHLQACRESGDRAGIAASLRRLGNIACARKDHQRSVMLLTAALQAATESDSPDVDPISVDLALARRALGPGPSTETVPMEMAIAVAMGE